VAELVKNEIHEDLTKNQWRANLKLLEEEASDYIRGFELSRSNPKEWVKPVDVIYGEQSPFFNSQH
jgi:hypothetical protein